MNAQNKQLRVAVLDLYNGEPNQGMGCIRDILKEYAGDNDLALQCDEFDVRQKLEIADTSYEIYISTGGPGSPLDTEGSAWEKLYFSLIRQLEDVNSGNTKKKKHVFFICHSFQLMCRYYALGNICKRKSPSYGVFPVHKTEEGRGEPLLLGLPDIFYAVDSREWQVIAPDKKQLAAVGGSLLALEKERPHVPLGRALMAIRFSPYFIGTQFHPEADPVGMNSYLQKEEKKKQVIKDLGEAKYNNMLEQLHDPDKIMLTQKIILPTFLDHALQCLQEA
jgi:GMP synthase-like glutamine amidotransferase